jgi:hypothetical protein
VSPTSPPGSSATISLNEPLARNSLMPDISYSHVAGPSRRRRDRLRVGRRSRAELFGLLDRTTARIGHCPNGLGYGMNAGPGGSLGVRVALQRGHSPSGHPIIKTRAPRNDRKHGRGSGP